MRRRMESTRLDDGLAREGTVPDGNSGRGDGVEVRKETTGKCTQHYCCPHAQFAALPCEFSWGSDLTLSASPVRVSVSQPLC